MAVSHRFGLDDMRCRMFSATSFLDLLPEHRSDLVLLPRVPPPVVRSLFRRMNSHYRCVDAPADSAMSAPTLDRDCHERKLLASLTPRQREVLACVASGHDIKDVARLLGVAPKSVENHLRSIRQRLGMKNRVNRVHLCRLAIRVGLIEA
ncbi:MAG: helix-turn-helix transcriptional regulator [Planctomycetota bacterium]|nr:helix-turn-helix transcriptional regulator [Planctomycetota bacterium]